MNRRVTPNVRTNNNNNAVGVDNNNNSVVTRRLVLDLNNATIRHSRTYYQLLREKGYRVGRTLGSGSYAKVKETDYHDPSGNVKRRMAIKIIDRQKAPSDFINRFFPREKDISARLNHPNIIKVNDIFDISHRTFIVMEIAEGGDLLDYIKRNGALPNQLAKRLFNELASAVRYCHNLQISHRDLKCENILLDKDGHIKLADFGFARYCVDTAGKRILSTTYCGSAAYAAPEILQGQPYNPKLYDIWSLGCILYIMVCGSMPFDDRDVKKLVKIQQEGKVKFPSRLGDRLDMQVRDLIYHMLEVDVTKRYNIDKVLKHKWFEDVHTTVAVTTTITTNTA